MISNIIFFVITLGVLVAFHEWGHFWVARRCGVFVQRFSIGFGKPLKSWMDKQGTEYVVASIPLGGYVKMLDTRNEEVAPSDYDKTFNSKSNLQKAAIVAAGPIANFLLAFFVYYAVFIAGVPGLTAVVGDIEPESLAAKAGMRSGELIVSVDGIAVKDRSDVHNALVKRIGDTGSIEFSTIDARQSRVALAANASLAKDLKGDFFYELSIDRWLAAQKTPAIYDSLGFFYWLPSAPPVITQLSPEGPAAEAGLKVGDEFISVDGVAVDTWRAFASEIKPRPGERVDLTVKRDGLLVEKTVKIASAEESGETVGRIGVVGSGGSYPEEMRVVDRSGPIAAIPRALRKTAEMINLTVDSIVKMIKGLISPSNLSGPITIAQVASDTAERGLISYLQFLALLSVSLGVLNLLPVPMLDGGQLVFITAEGLTGKPVPMGIQLGAQQVGILLIFSLMAFAIYNDFARIL